MEIRTRRPLWGCQRWIFFAFFNNVSSFFFFFQSEHLWVIVWRMKTWNCPRILVYTYSVFPFFSSVSLHVFLVQAVAFSLWHNQGLFNWWSPAEWKAFHWVPFFFIAFYCSLWSPAEPPQVNKTAFDFLLCIFSPLFAAVSEKPFSFSAEADHLWDHWHVFGMEVGKPAIWECAWALA